MLSSPCLSIDQTLVGPGHPVYFIAEVGSNHNQDYDLACRSIEAVAKAGANAVKFQTFRADSHYSKKAPGFSYLANQSTYDLIKSLELNRDWQIGLKECAENNGLSFLSSPCDLDAVDSLEAINVCAYKVASFDLTDDDLISYIASKNKPLILSTGLANLSEIQFAIDAAHKMNNHEIVLLQCTSLYPAPSYLSNLKVMRTLSNAFGVVCGYSDHTLGGHISLAAVSMGASVIEKHFTLDRNLPGPDHPFAIEPEELCELITQIREVESAIGDGIKNGPRPEELEMAEKGRRSLHALVPIKAGQIIERNMICIKRPGLGISPMLRALVIGKRATTDIDPDQWITWDMV